MGVKRDLAVLVSLGCAKNLVDSETMVPQILRAGYTMSDDASRASLIVVNTCGFLQSSVEEAIEQILDLAAYKKSSCRFLVVTGCMVQRYGTKLLELLPEVDLFLGTSHYDKLYESLAALRQGEPQELRIGRPRHLPTSSTPRLRSTSPFSSYLKIAEGCSNCCTFCMIPKLRGPYRSRTVEDVLVEAQAMASEGVREINLIAQDTTAFGSDLNQPHALMKLIEHLDRIDSIRWIRLLYVYPDRVTPNLLNTMHGASKVVPYLDIPLQHSVPSILASMRRNSEPANTGQLIDMIRSAIPDIALRTSLMVGYPGETEKDFESLCRFVQWARFDHVGVFAFSPEPGTRAAKLPMQIDEQVREERRRTLMELQAPISRQKMEEKVGKILPVLIEGYHPETELLLAGRLASQAPEVDGSVIITSGVGEVGDITFARITAAHDYDVEAELLDSQAVMTDVSQAGQISVSSDQS